MHHSKVNERLNPNTGERFKIGDSREDEFKFDGYIHSVVRKNGYFKEMWRSPEAFDRRQEKKKESKKKRYDFNTKYMNDEKVKRGCNHCGEHFYNDPECLDFHHIDPKTKDVSVARIWRTSLKQLDKMIEEIKKCIVLCSNCHRKETKRIRNEN